jgi:hypothetical protein
MDLNPINYYNLIITPQSKSYIRTCRAPYKQHKLKIHQNQYQNIRILNYRTKLLVCWITPLNISWVDPKWNIFSNKVEKPIEKFSGFLYGKYFGLFRKAPIDPFNWKIKMVLNIIILRTDMSRREKKKNRNSYWTSNGSENEKQIKIYIIIY